MLYLAHNYDKDFKLWYDPIKNPNEYSEILQWTFFAVSRTSGTFV